MNKSHATRAFGAVAIVLTALSLSACGGQSTAEACGKLQNELDGASKEMTASLSGFATDPQGSSAALGAVSGQFVDSVKGVSNTDVKAKADAAGAALSEFHALVKGLAADPSKASAQLSAVTDASRKVQDSLNDLSKLCTK